MFRRMGRALGGQAAVADFRVADQERRVLGAAACRRRSARRRLPLAALPFAHGLLELPKLILPPSIGASLPSIDSATFKVTNGRPAGRRAARLGHCWRALQGLTSFSVIAGERAKIRADVEIVFVFGSLQKADDPIGERREHDLGRDLEHVIRDHHADDQARFPDSQERQWVKNQGVDQPRPRWSTRWSASRGNDRRS